MKDYKVVGGVSFSEGTKESVINILLDAMKHRDRIRIFFGDAESGADWCGTFGNMGTIGLSCGPNKVPMLKHYVRSMGGICCIFRNEAISTNSIVKITRNKKVIYQHPKYNCNIKIDGYNIVDCHDNKKIYWHANDPAKVQRFFEFLKGTRNNY